MTDLDIRSPSKREHVLRSISPEAAREHEALLRQIFREEIAYRQRDEDHEYFENIYWCAYLLFHVADPGDAELMWIAKNLNMDVGCGFDVENMVGAGVEPTIQYLRQKDLGKAADYIAKCLRDHSQQTIDDWRKGRRRHFYGD